MRGDYVPRHKSGGAVGTSVVSTKHKAEEEKKRKKKENRQKIYSIWTSQLVPHASTNQT